MCPDCGSDFCDGSCDSEPHAYEDRLSRRHGEPESWEDSDDGDDND